MKIEVTELPENFNHTSDWGTLHVGLYYDKLSSMLYLQPFSNNNVCPQGITVPVEDIVSSMLEDSETTVVNNGTGITAKDLIMAVAVSQDPSLINNLR